MGLGWCFASLGIEHGRQHSLELLQAPYFYTQLAGLEKDIVRLKTATVRECREIGKQEEQKDRNKEKFGHNLRLALLLCVKGKLPGTRLLQSQFEGIDSAAMANVLGR